MFGALVRLCGLSANEAAHLIGASRAEVVGWLRNESAPPDEAMQKLYRLFAAQEQAAEEIIEAWERSGKPHALTLKVAANNEAARAEGWPSMSAQMVPIAIAQATLTDLTIGFETSSE